MLFSGQVLASRNGKLSGAFGQWLETNIEFHFHFDSLALSTARPRYYLVSSHRREGQEHCSIADLGVLKSSFGF